MTDVDRSAIEATSIYVIACEPGAERCSARTDRSVAPSKTH